MKFYLKHNLSFKIANYHVFEKNNQNRSVINSHRNSNGG